MFKKTLFAILCLCYFISFSQMKISGKIIDENSNSVEGASVYLNNTSVGVSTKSDGKFELTVKEGTYELIVSYLGYTTIKYLLSTASYSKPLFFKLEVSDYLLNEIVLKKTIYDDIWKYNLTQFKNNFLGRTNLAEQCEILNPKTLHFEFDNKTGILVAEVREPLKIKHKGLGYLISFDLVHFTLGRQKVDYFGYTKFENLTGGKRKQKRWKKNRLKAYNGSKAHFVRSLIKGTTKNEGFNINRFRREVNPNRPTEKQIERARQMIKLSGITTPDLSKKITNPLTIIDSAKVVLQKISLPKYIHYLYKQDINSLELIQKKNSKNILSFKNYISVIYTKEAEENNYVMGIFGKKRNPLTVQTSSVVMLTKTALLENSGEINSPLDVFYGGYWAYEQFADVLPLNYQLSKD